MTEFKVVVKVRWWVRPMARLAGALVILRIISPARAYGIAMWAAHRGLLVNGRRMGA